MVAATFTLLHAPRRYPVGRATDARPYLVMVDLETLPENAMICSSWATSCPLWYAQHVLGQRPDVDVINARPGNWPQFIAPNLDRPIFTTINPGRLEEYTVTPYRVFWRVEPAITKPWMVVPNANTTILSGDVLVLVGSNESP